MKFLLKLALVILSFAGVAYWLLSKFFQPAVRLREQYQHRQDEGNEE